MKHFISLETAKKMTALYRSKRESILIPQEQGKDLLAICETFDIASVNVLIKQGSAKLRIYYGMDESLKVHAILVGVDAYGRDILPPEGLETKSLATDGEHPESDPVILEEGMRCPNICPPPSPLNP